ncbi:MAG TPA: 2-hydroxymuconate tautomerase [Terriglobia bacterium]|nr:2-hydroxymuconate tautomerase [Terriglobia bacterium]
MPHIQITLLEGRTPEQKRRIVERLTQVMVEESGTKKESVTVSFLEVSQADYASGGVLVLDRNKS